MSLFKKPKKNIRLRESGDADDTEDDKTVEIVNAVKSGSKKDKKPTKKPPTSQPVLSFDLDLNEGDDGEIFQVKKSSQSKKMRKLLDKERKKKKEPNKEGKETTASNGSEKKSTITTDDDIVITVKNTLPALVLNGREAVAAAVDGISSDEEESSGRHKFSKASSDVKMLLQRGRIPDAATIHAVRKQRQHVREMSDFIPISEENSREKENGGRLDDDDEGSDADEDRIKMTIDTASEDRMRLRAEFTAAQQDESDESDKGEEEEWEQQQIRKGVTGAQIAAVQQETMYYQHYLMGGCPPAPIISMEPPAPPTIGNAFLQPPRPSDPPTANSVLSRLQNRLGELREVERNHKTELDRGQSEMGLLVEEAEKLRESSPGLEEKFQFYQELRGYVTDLVECLDEKILVIEMLEERVLTAFSRRVQEGTGRRRQDVQDQAHELPSNPLMANSIGRDEFMIRRIAEREGRRIRRQRQRELKGLNIGHNEGMSSDDELTEVQQIAHNNTREIIEKDAKLVFDDVFEDFSTLEGILSKFQTWREEDMHSYTEAYVSLCLPKILGPIIRLNVLFWNPLLPGSTELDKSSWYKAILLFGMKPNESEDSIKKDPDVQLLPRIMDRVILPRLNQLVKEGWDPMSSSQTICLVSLVTRLIQEYPTLTHNSKTVRQLMESVIAKINSALDSDVFIPLYSKVRLTDAKVNNFFMRQCASAVKLLGNIARWQGLLNDNILYGLAIDSLLNRYLMMAIGSTTPLQAANIIHMIGSVLPRIWISSKLPRLNIFLNQIRTISLQLSADIPVERDAIERMSSIL